MGGGGGDKESFLRFSGGDLGGHFFKTGLFCFFGEMVGFFWVLGKLF